MKTLYYDIQACILCSVEIVYAEIYNWWPLGIPEAQNPSMVIPLKTYLSDQRTLLVQ